MLLRRQAGNDQDALRGLFTLAEDHNALALLDRKIMGQSDTIQTDR